MPRGKGDKIMKLHLKVLEGEEQNIITELNALCGENIKLDPYEHFIDVEIETTYESGLCAIFSEKHYLKGDYRIVLFKGANRDEQVEIPLKFIDCLFGL